ncbi:MAG: preprotein translocase subunit SecE [Phycisphaerales bacterium]|nr:preprotein translocase subunit SecE [Phycisphaerales bacterium]
MALGIYKAGQGYWVRVLTAVGAGLLALATAAWMWGETGALNLPNSAWDVSLTNASGALTPGQTAKIFQRSEDEKAEEIELGTMEVGTYAASQFGAQTRLVKPALGDGKVPSDMDLVRADNFTADVGQAAVRPIPIVDPLYVQGALAGVVMLGGALVIFWLVGTKPSTCEFLIQTDGEMKKVNWSTRREVLGSTWVVIGASVMIAAILYVVDLAFQWFFVSIDVLQR